MNQSHRGMLTVGENWGRALKKLQIQNGIKVSLFPSIKGSLYGTALHFFH